MGLRMKQRQPLKAASTLSRLSYSFGLVLFGIVVSVIAHWACSQYDINRRIRTRRTPPLSDGDLAAHRHGDTRIGMHTMLFGRGTRFEEHVIDTPANSSYERAVEVALQYSNRWGYPMWVARQPLLVGPSNDGLTKTWSKLALTLSIVLNELRKPESERLQWVYFIDADTVITNHNIPLETFVPPEDDAALSSLVLLISTDQWGTLNTGGYFVRVCQDAVWLLSATQALGGLHMYDASFMLNEQESLTRTAVQPSFIDKVAVVPAEWFNADAFHMFAQHDYFDIANVRPVYHLGDFMVHFMSDNKHGWEEMLAAALAVPHNTSLHVPLEQTRLQTDPSLSPLPFWYRWLTFSLEQRRQMVREAERRVG